MLKPNKIITTLATILVLGAASCQKVPSREVSEKDKSKQEEVLPTTSYKAEDYVRNNFSYNVFSEYRTWSDKNEFLENASKLVGTEDYFYSIEMFKAGIAEWLHYINMERERKVSNPNHRMRDTMWVSLASLVNSGPEQHHFGLWKLAIDRLYQNDIRRHDLEEDFRLLCSRIGNEDNNIRMSYDECIQELIRLEGRLGNYDIAPDSLNLSTPMDSFETLKNVTWNQNMKTFPLLIADRTYIFKEADIEELRDLNTPEYEDKAIHWEIIRYTSSKKVAFIEYRSTLADVISGPEDPYREIEEGTLVFREYGDKWLLCIRESSF